MNKHIIIGRLGQDPDYRSTESTTITKFSVATSEHFGGEEKTEWHNVVCFGKTADNTAKFLSKGSLVAVEGRSQTSSWQHKDHSDVKCFRTEIIANRVEFLSTNKRDDGQPHVEGAQAQDDSEDIPF